MFSILKAILRRIKNELIDSALTRITHTAETTVASISQTIAKELREKSADGRLTSKDAQELKAVAVQTIFDQVPGDIMKLATDGVNDLTRFVEAKIEQAVVKQKAVLPPLSRIFKMGSGE